MSSESWSGSVEARTDWVGRQLCTENVRCHVYTGAKSKLHKRGGGKIFVPKCGFGG